MTITIGTDHTRVRDKTYVVVYTNEERQLMEPIIAYSVMDAKRQAFDLYGKNVVKVIYIPDVK